MEIIKEPSGMPLLLTSPSSKDPGELTPFHSTQNSNSATKKKKRRKAKESYLHKFDDKELVDVDIDNNEGYDSEALKIPFSHKDSIINFDGNNHNVPSMPAKKRRKRINLSFNQSNDRYSSSSL
ncbi:stress response protein nst1 [Gigaspora margarita]|uniref:Stress response protein nst1 n=1 Tax=Gigaspora margarita TaxID=4874 RepID=A0A8H3X9V1_GIGMA|nr:stress response protein nst1 [Gigaspora margarita]